MDSLAEKVSKALTIGSNDDAKRTTTPTDSEASQPVYQVLSSSPSPSPTDRTLSEHSSTEPSSEPSIQASEDTSKPQVFESKTSLVPACFESHGTHKGKGNEGQPFTSPLTAQRCGRLELCDKGAIMPPSVPQTPFRLITSDPANDLRRWLMTPNDTISGGTEKRGVDFLKDTRYTDDMLLSTIGLAIQEIRSEHPHIRSLLEYASRSPYNRTLQIREKANMRYLSIEAEDLGGMPRKKLQEELVDAASEMDWLRTKADEVGEKIIGYKVAEARRGDWAETEDLLRLGLVDETWVQEYCNV